MKKRVIHVPLTVQGVDKAIEELNNYKKWLFDCIKRLVEELGQEGIQISSLKFGQAVYDGTNDVKVSIEKKNDYKVAVVAIGSATLFIEFGTGIKYPDDHPEAAKNGMVRGEYGHHLGRLQKGWRYSGNPGTNGVVITEGKHSGEVHTYGNPANMCMYYTIRELEDKFEEIVKRVFM